MKKIIILLGAVFLISCKQTIRCVDFEREYPDYIICENLSHDQCKDLKATGCYDVN